MKNSAVHIILIIITGFFLYANSLHGEFICDDIALIKYNDSIKKLSNIPRILTEDMGSGTGSSSNFNRPLQIISFMFNYALGGFNVVGYHISNITLHIAVAVCIYWFINVIFHNLTLAFLTSLLFLVHPVNTEAASYLSGRADSLVFLFILLSLIFYIKSFLLKNRQLFILSLLSCVMAILSKESSIILPLLILLCHYVLDRKIEIKRFLILSGLFAAYVLLKLEFMAGMGFSSQFYQSALFWRRIPGFFVAIAEYLRIIFLPFGLHFEYGNRLFSFLNYRAMFGLIAVLFLLFLAFRRKMSNKIISFSILWFFIGLLPVTNVFPVINTDSFMMWHWVYISSLGFFLIIANVFCYKFKHRLSMLAARSFIIALLIWHAFETIKLNYIWNDPIKFYKRSLMFTPDNWRFYHNLALNYDYKGNLKEAEETYKRVLEINPKAMTTYYNLADIYRRRGNNEAAVRLYALAIEISPNAYESYFEFGNFYQKIGRQKEALALYSRAIEFNPYHALAYCKLAEVYNAMGDQQQAQEARKKAIVLISRALEVAPGYATLYSELVRLYQEGGGKSEVMKLYNKAVENNVEYFDAYYIIGNIHSDSGNHLKAIKLYNKAIMINPGSADTYFRLGNSYCSIGQIRKAVAPFKKAAELNYNLGAVYENLAKVYYGMRKYGLAVIYRDKAAKERGM